MFDKFCEILDLYFEKIFGPVYEFNAGFAGVIGLPETSSIYLLVLFFPLILSVVYRFIPRGFYTVKHIYNLFFGLFLCGLLFKSGIIVPLLSTFAGYLLLHVLPHKHNRFVTPILMFVILSFCNLREMYYHYMEWRATFITVQMLLTFKISSVAINLNDGERMKEDENNVLEELQSFALKKRPGLLQYFSFNFFYGTITTGPVFEYVHFIEWIENDLPFPFDILTIVKRLFTAFFFLALFVISDLKGINTDSGFCDEEYLQSHSSIYLLLYSSFVIFCMRAKYLFAWFFAEAISITAGFGYSGRNNENGGYEWKNIQQTDLYLLYTASSVRNALNSWNMATSRWLRRYVYVRAPFPSRTSRNLSAMTVSAFWHGFYPGYYFSWPVLAVLVQIYIQGYQKIRPRVQKWMGWENYTPIWMIFLLSLVLRTFGNHVVMPFHLYSFECSMRFFNRFYWVLHIIIVVVFVWLSMFVSRPRKKKVE